MWSDNETEIDYLGFGDLVEQIIDIVHQPQLLPVTLGVFGDWGSGKSSLMAMARAKLRDDPRVVSVSFSPWQHEDYDDVKTALILAVMSALEGDKSPLEKLADGEQHQVRRLLRRLYRRVNALRLLSWAVKGASAAFLAASGEATLAGILGTSALGDIAGSIKLKAVADKAADVLSEEADKSEAEADDAKEPVEQGIGRFRRDFADVVRVMDIDALVVFIDDLDRCLPESVVDTLEAMRLFLAVPKTVFVIGADERIVRHAIGRRYPELPSPAGDSTRSLDIGRDYLEKMIQIPVRIPPLTAAETETYLNLLGAELHLQGSDRAKAIAAADANRVRRLSVPFDHGVAERALGNVAPRLSEHMALVARIAPLLAAGHDGNPRLVKRFFNTLLQRQRLAQRRAVALKADVLAKLMLLEYFHTPQFRDLFRWQLEAAPAAPPQIGALEAAAARGRTATPVDGEESDAELRRWVEDPALREWLNLEPRLAAENLEPYLHFSRDRLAATAPLTRRLAPELQELLARLLGESDTVRAAAQAELLRTEEASLSAVYAELLSAFVRDPRRLDNKVGVLLVAVAGARRALVPALANALRSANSAAIQPAFALSLRTTFKPISPEIRRVLEHWQSNGPSALASAAKRALTTS